VKIVAWVLVTLNLDAHAAWVGRAIRFAGKMIVPAIIVALVLALIVFAPPGSPDNLGEDPYHHSSR
jgi:sugar phosphate permease